MARLQGQPDEQPPAHTEVSAFDQVLTLAMRPFLSRCAEVLQQRPSSPAGCTRTARCAAASRTAVITPAAERHLICGRCGAALEVRAADLPVLPQQRPIADHVVCHAGWRIPRVRVRRLHAVSEGLRRPARDAPGHAGRGRGGDAAARRGGDAEGVYGVVQGDVEGVQPRAQSLLRRVTLSGFERGAEQVLRFAREPVEEVPCFPEAARVRLGAEHDDGDLRAALRQPEQRGEAVAGFADEAGLARRARRRRRS